MLPTPARHGEGDADHFNCGFWILVSKQGIVSVEVTHFLQGEHNEMIFFKIVNLLCLSVLKFPLTVL